MVRNGPKVRRRLALLAFCGGLLAAVVGIERESVRLTWINLFPKTVLEGRSWRYTDSTPLEFLDQPGDDFSAMFPIWRFSDGRLLMSDGCCGSLFGEYRARFGSFQFRDPTGTRWLKFPFQFQSESVFSVELPSGSVLELERLPQESENQRS